MVNCYSNFETFNSRNNDDDDNDFFPPLTEKHFDHQFYPHNTHWLSGVEILFLFWSLANSFFFQQTTTVFNHHQHYQNLIDQKYDMIKPGMMKIPCSIGG